MSTPHSFQLFDTRKIPVRRCKLAALCELRIHPLFKISELKHISSISEGLIMTPALKTTVASLCLGGLVAVLSPCNAGVRSQVAALRK